MCSGEKEVSRQLWFTCAVAQSGLEQGQGDELEDMQGGKRGPSHECASKKGVMHTREVGVDLVGGNELAVCSASRLPPT